MSDPAPRTNGLLFLGQQPHAACQRCGRYERDARGWCHCVHTSCPIGLLLRQRRQRATPPTFARR